jgi:hypothetical protein
VIDPLSHVALAAHEHNDGVMIRRRSYNYTDGLDDNGQLNAGLLFVPYQNDSHHFVDIQNRLGANDLLNEYIRHIGSAILVVPPAPERGHYLGQPLFTLPVDGGTRRRDRLAMLRSWPFPICPRPSKPPPIRCIPPKTFVAAGRP